MLGGRIGGDRSVSEEDFQRSFLTAALLQQDDVRAFLSSPSSERFQTLSQMLGLAVLGDFVEALGGTETRVREILNQRRNDLKNAQEAVENARRAAEEARARISAAPSVQDADNQFRAEQNQLGVQLPPVNRDDGRVRYYGSIIALADDWQSNLRAFESAIIALRNHLATQPDPLLSLDVLHEAVAQNASRLTEARDEAVEAQARAEALWVDAQTRADLLQSLASAALPLLADFCPVCTQAIEEDSVRERLNLILSGNPALASAAQTYHAAREHAGSLRTQAAEAQSRIQEVDNQRTIASVWGAVHDSLLAEAQGIASSLDYIHPPSLTVHPETGHAQLRDDFEGWIVGARSTTLRIHTAARSALTAYQVSQNEAHAQNLDATIMIRLGEVTSVEDSVALAEGVLRVRQDLVKLAREQSTRVVNEVFSELEPVVQDVFARLAPHPTFDELSFSHEVFRSQGTSVPIAHDRLTGTAINPALVFSSAQANVAALCYFVGLAFASSESDFGFVLMDDPLQSMDDANVLGFSDLCRFLRRKKQVIVSSHEARLTNLLRRKLSPRNEAMRTVVIDFTSWNRSGPNIRVEEIEQTQESAVLALVK